MVVGLLAIVLVLVCSEVQALTSCEKKSGQVVVQMAEACTAILIADIEIRVSLWLNVSTMEHSEAYSSITVSNCFLNAASPSNYFIGFGGFDSASQALGKPPALITLQGVVGTYAVLFTGYFPPNSIIVIEDCSIAAASVPTPFSSSAPWRVLIVDAKLLYNTRFTVRRTSLREISGTSSVAISGASPSASVLALSTNVSIVIQDVVVTGAKQLFACGGLYIDDNSSLLVVNVTAVALRDVGVSIGTLSISGASRLVFENTTLRSAEGGTIFHLVHGGGESKHSITFGSSMVWSNCNWTTAAGTGSAVIRIVDTLAISYESSWLVDGLTVAASGNAPCIESDAISTRHASQAVLDNVYLRCYKGLAMEDGLNIFNGSAVTLSGWDVAVSQGVIAVTFPDLSISNNASLVLCYWVVNAVAAANGIAISIENEIEVEASSTMQVRHMSLAAYVVGFRVIGDVVVMESSSFIMVNNDVTGISFSAVGVRFGQNSGNYLHVKSSSAMVVQGNAFYSGNGFSLGLYGSTQILINSWLLLRNNTLNASTVPLAMSFGGALTDTTSDVTLISNHLYSRTSTNPVRVWIGGEGRVNVRCNDRIEEVEMLTASSYSLTSENFHVDGCGNCSKAFDCFVPNIAEKGGELVECRCDCVNGSDASLWCLPTAVTPYNHTCEPPLVLAPATTTTAMPTSTTAMPTSTTAMPTSTTAMPTSTTAMPTSTTAMPTSTTAMPTSTTAVPTSTTAMPTSTALPLAVRSTNSSTLSLTPDVLSLTRSLTKVSSRSEATGTNSHTPTEATPSYSSSLSDASASRSVSTSASSLSDSASIVESLSRSGVATRSASHRYTASPSVASRSTSGTLAPSVSLVKLSRTSTLSSSVAFVEPQESSTVEEAARDATRGATVASAVTVSPTSATSLARLTSMQAVISCDLQLDVDEAVNLLSLTLGPQDGEQARGAVVGNLLLVVACVAAVGLVVLVIAVCKLKHGQQHASLSIRLHATLMMLHCPGAIVIPMAAILQPTLTSAVTLLYIDGWAGDVALGVLAVVVCTGFVCWVLVTTLWRFPCDIVARSKYASQSALLVGRGATVRLFLFRLLSPTHQWVSPTHPEWKRRNYLVFADVRCPWYVALDVLASLAIGIMTGLPKSSRGICIAQAVTFFVAYTLLTVALVFRPMVQCLMTVFCGSMNLIGVVASTSLLVYAADASVFPDGPEVVQTCALVMSGIGMIKTAIDLIDGCLSVRSKIRSFVKKGAASAPTASFTINDMDDAVSSTHSDADVPLNALDAPLKSNLDMFSDDDNGFGDFLVPTAGLSSDSDDGTTMAHPLLENDEVEMGKAMGGSNDIAETADAILDDLSRRRRQQNEDSLLALGRQDERPCDDLLSAYADLKRSNIGS